MLRIGEFSKLSRVSIRMLRHYDEIGLLTPALTDEETSYRYYSEAQLPVVNRITALKNLGFRLSGITELLHAQMEPDLFSQMLRLRKAELLEEAEENRQRLRLLEYMMKKDGMDMSYDVTMKELPERYVASVRKVIPFYNSEQMLWNILTKETAPLRLQPGDPCLGIAVFHDKEHKEANVDVEVQLSVKGSYTDTENVRFKTEPRIQIASATYQGSYESINEVNEAVANWVLDNGYTFDGASFCIYHVSPHDTENPDELVTEVCYPVKKKN